MSHPPGRRRGERACGGRGGRARRRRQRQASSGVRAALGARQSAWEACACVPPPPRHTCGRPPAGSGWGRCGMWPPGRRGVQRGQMDDGRAGCVLQPWQPCAGWLRWRGCSVCRVGPGRVLSKLDPAAGGAWGGVGACGMEQAAQAGAGSMERAGGQAGSNKGSRQGQGAGRQKLQNCSTRGSQVIPQPSTNLAQPCLTSEC
jgi:hypothetical protein